MSIKACAEIVERADPARFRAVMLAPVSARRVLFPIYAFNAEVARAPWVTSEPLIAEMRLQWWYDALEEIATGNVVRKHEVTVPLAQAIGPDQARILQGAVNARQWDIYRDPFADDAAFEAHLQATAGNLMWAAACALGKAEESAVRSFAYAAGVAGWFQAIPALQAAGRTPIPTNAEVAETWIYTQSKTALARLAHAQNTRKAVSKAAAPALYAGWAAKPVLLAARRNPESVLDGSAEIGPARASMRLAHVGLRGWWV